MKLSIRSVHKQGSAAEEYVTLDVLEDTDLDFFAIADTSYASPTHISNKLRHFFWFPKTKAAAGDIVFLNTGHGKNMTQSKGGKTFHFFYWGLGTAVWNNTGDAAVLFEMEAWNTTKAR